jgi:hypothetical protein
VIFVYVVARRDIVVQQIDVLKRVDNKSDPIYSHRRKHEGGEGEKPFPCPTLESIGAVSSQKNLELRKNGMKQIGRWMPYTMA